MGVLNDWPSLGADDPLHKRAHQKALRRVRDLCLAMPDTAERISRGHIPIITVGGKNFCIFWRADKRPNVCVKSHRISAPKRKATTPEKPAARKR